MGAVGGCERLWVVLRVGFSGKPKSCICRRLWRNGNKGPKILSA